MTHKLIAMRSRRRFNRRLLRQALNATRDVMKSWARCAVYVRTGLRSGAIGVGADLHRALSEAGHIAGRRRRYDA